jgi:hypothetical protein
VVAPCTVVVRKNSMRAARATSTYEGTVYHLFLVLEEGDHLSQRLRPCQARLSVRITVTRENESVPSSRQHQIHGDQW